MAQRKLLKGKKEIVDLNDIQTKFVEYSDEDQKAEENFRTNTFVQKFNYLNNLIEYLIDENPNITNATKFYNIGLFKMLMGRIDPKKVADIEITPKEFKEYFLPKKHYISDELLKELKDDISNSYYQSVLKDIYINKKID